MLETLILVLAMAICGFVAYFVFMKIGSKEEAATLSVAAMVSISILVAQYNLLSFNPLQRYSGAYAAMGSITVGLAAEVEASERFQPKLSEKAYEVAWFFLVVGSMAAVGLLMWACNYILGIPVDIFVALLPGYWMYYRMSQQDNFSKR